MKISASIYSNSKEKSLEQLVRELDAHNIDMLHIDCVDSPKVFDDIRAIKQFSTTPIDLHIISSNPEQYIPLVEELGVEYVCFQYENLSSMPTVPENSVTQYGLAITSNTSIDVFEQVKDRYSFVMMMTTVPGMTGGVFSKDSLQKIIEFKHRYPKTQIEVDGGVNDQIAFILRLLGVNAVVSGSYLLNHESLGAGMLSLHKAPSNNTKQSFSVGDFTTPLHHLPVISNGDNSFRNILQQIEKGGQGFVMFADAEGKLTGIVSNADVRKGLVKHIDNLNGVQGQDLINTTPVHIHDTASVADMAKLLNNLNFIVLFLPVVDSNNVLKGAVLLNHLTRI